MKLDNAIWQEVDALIPGWMSEAEAEFLIENTQGTNYVEIGVAFGKSLRLVRNHFPEMKVVGIDKINHGVDKKVSNVTIHYGDANKIVKECDAETIDTLFIDGDHTFDGCLEDFINWYAKVKPGGRIIFHDYGRPTKEHEGVTRAVDAIKCMLIDFKSINYIACGTKAN